MTAPSVAPVERPSVSGDASGLRRNAWKTTPATARPLPTSSAASTRGSRAMKKTCASTLSANGIDRSKTRDSAIGVVPTSGAARHAAAATAPKPAIVTTIRRRRSLDARKRHHDEMPRAWMIGDVGIHAVERPDVLARQHGARRAGGDHAAALEQHEVAAERRRQVQIVRRYRHRDAPLA